MILHEQVEPILYYFHMDMSGAHMEMDAIIGKIKDCYYCPQLGEDVKEYINL